MLVLKQVEVESLAALGDQIVAVVVLTYWAGHPACLRQTIVNFAIDT